MPKGADDHKGFNPNMTPKTVDERFEEFKNLRTLAGEPAEAVLKDGSLLSNWLLTFLHQEIERAEERGWKKRDWEMAEEKEVDEALEKHMTAEGWCCVCPADLGTLEAKIALAKEEERRRIREEFRRVEIPPLNHQSWCDKLDVVGVKCNCDQSPTWWLIEELKDFDRSLLSTLPTENPKT